MKTTYYIIITIFLISVSLKARPQYSMITGNRCISCHTSYQGGALRNDLGIYSRSSLINLEETSTGEFIEKLSQFSTQLDGNLRFGADVRFQSAKLGGPSNSKREIFNMQTSPYLYIKPINWMEIYGSYNLSPNIYNNQNRWIAFLTIKPDINYPELRIGQIKPSISNLYDDHTLLIRQITEPSRPTPLLPPDYSELGAELNFDYNKIFNVQIGIFKTDFISKILITDKPIVDKNSLASLIRIAINPRFAKNQINTNIGGSYYSTNNFNITNFFVHLGWTDNISLLSEYLIAENKSLIKINNYFIEVLYHFNEAADFSLRFEQALSNYFDNQEYLTNQYVIGLNLYLFPFIELRPEYRIYDREFIDGYHSQWAFQLHFYY